MLKMSKNLTKREQKVMRQNAPVLNLRDRRLTTHKDIKRAVSVLFCAVLLLTANAGCFVASQPGVQEDEQSQIVHVTVGDQTDRENMEFAEMPELNFPEGELDPEATMQGFIDIMSDQFLYDNGFSGETPVTEPVTAGQIKVACVGDSLTYGYGVMMWQENNYPAQLQNMLGDEYHVQNFGVSNYCVKDDSDHPYTSHSTYTDSIEYDADVLVFMMGSNDAKTVNWTSAEDYKAALLELLDSYGDVQVVLCTPPTFYPYEMAEDGYSVYGHELEKIEEVAQVVREVAQERGYVLVDLYEMSLSNPQWFCLDGVHLNVEGATALAEAVQEVVSKIA